MVVGGHEGGPYLNTAEVISLNPEYQPVPGCNRVVANIPQRIAGAGGGTVFPGK